LHGQRHAMPMPAGLPMPMRRLSLSPHRRAKRKPRIMPPLRSIIATAALVAAPLAACASAPAMFTAHGQEQVCGDLLNGTSPSDYSDISDGSQVTITDSKGGVVATGTLASDPKDSNSLEAVYNFTVVVPGGLPRYGIQVGRNRGTIWFSESQMRKGPGVSLGC
jgi:hypothetical protein